MCTGCAVNGYERYYVRQPGIENLSTNPNAYVEKPPSVPNIYAHGEDVKADVRHMAENGYVLIGTSSFFGPAKIGTQAQAIQQGKKVGAAVVLIKSTYKDTLTGTLPYTVPNAPQVATVNTNGNVNSFGSSGYANGTYSSTSTVTMPGGSTTYDIPFAVTRSDFLASYWVARDVTKIHFGGNVSNLPDDVRARLKRNTGAYITIVIRGTPAFRADILEGDVILKINDADVIDAKSFNQQLTQLSGQQVELSILRDAEPITIRMTLVPAGS